MDNFNINFNNGQESVSENNLKGGVRKEVITDKKMLSIFNVLDNGNNILENDEISKLKKLIVQYAAEDGDKSDLSNKEAKHLLKSLNLNLKVKDLFVFLGFLKTEAGYIKNCETNSDTQEITITYQGKDNYTGIYDADGNLIKEQYYYDDGKTLKEEIIHENDGNIFKKYDKSGKLINQKSSKADGYVGLSKQGGNDCYLLSAINGIRLTDKGQNILNNLIKKEGNKYTITLPGAVKTANAMKNDKRFNKGIYITGVYTFTEAELESLLKQSGSKYSTGDPDTVLLEAAYEKYREEAHKTLQSNDLEEHFNLDNESGFENCNPSEPLAGGKAYDAIYILTGASSEYYFNVHQNETLTEQEMSNYDSDNIAAGLPKVIDKEYSKKKELNTLLDKIMHDGDDGHIDNAVTCSFHTDIGGHALTVKTVTKDGNVILINPWEPEETITMSREDFVNKVYAVTLTTI